MPSFLTPVEPFVRTTIFPDPEPETSSTLEAPSFPNVVEPSVLITIFPDLEPAMPLTLHALSLSPQHH
jgi:hypothetical protein